MQSCIYTSGYGYSKRLCEDITSWFLNKFLSRHKIEVEILHRGLKREEVFGWCSVQDCDWNPRCFLIELQTHLPKENYIQTLLHELYHCYQHVKGDLRDIRGIRCWKGIDCSQLNYEEMPWEIEAREKEETLYLEYLIEKNDVPVSQVVHFFPNRLMQVI
jgi:hypothetical protein